MTTHRFAKLLLLTGSLINFSAFAAEAARERSSIELSAPITSTQSVADGLIGISAGRLLRFDARANRLADISPPSRDAIAATQFIDAKSGWVAGSPSSQSLSTQVWRTEDGGQTWQSTPVALPEDVASLKLQFADTRNGWMIAKIQTSSNFSIARLYRTEDAGASWIEVAAPPAAGEIRFGANGRGFLLGGADGTSLFQSQDYGQTWRRVQLPLLHDAHKSFQLTLPILRERGHDVVAVVAALETTERLGNITQRVLEFSVDPSQSVARETAQHEITLAANRPARLIGGEHSLVLSGDIEQLTRSARAQLKVAIDRSGRLNAIAESQSVRWYSFADGHCAASRDCESFQWLAATPLSPNAAEYGRTVEAEARLVHASRESGIRSRESLQKRVAQSTRRGFDACAAPSVATLNAWFTSSPYRDVNFYMGGRNRACSQPNLTASWITQNLATGWYLIPTWVGYQSPTTICTGCAKFSTNSTTARTQGIDEANLAANAAEALGLSKPNMIYFNLEKYNTETAAEKAFVDGWSAQLRARGYVPGLYVHVANVASFAGIANPPDAVWVARWSGSGGSGPSTVPDPNRITDMSDTIFVNKRVWQHYGDFNTTWGGITLAIDANVSNGPLVGRDLTAQTITFGVLVDRDLSAGSFAVSATASSGLAVSFASLTSGTCSVSGSTVTLLAAGTCTVRASQAGNATYAAAPNVDRSFQIIASGPQPQTISFAALPTRVIGYQGFDLSATASSGLPVSYTSLTSSVCTVTNWRVAILAIGTCSIRASQAGNANFQAAANVDQSFSVIALASCSTVTASGDCDSDGIPNGVEASVSKSATVKDNDLFANDRLFIMQQYRDMLRKEADSAAQNYWLNEFSTGRHTRASMIEYLYGHNDFGVPASKVTRLYLAAYDRTPDFSGLFYWMDQLKTKTLADVAASFVSSAEFRAVHGALDDTAYVQFVFNTTLGRAATASEVSTWTSDLAAQRTTRGAMLAQFTEGATFVAAARSEVLTTLTYVGMLQRRPDNSGFTYWVGRLDSAVSTQSMISGFLASAEYRKRFLP